MGTVGPGSIHLLNGLYDAKKSHAPVLALCGQVPLAELGSDFFQEVDNDALFRDVAVVLPHGHEPRRSCPACSSRPSRARCWRTGVAVLTLPGDVGGIDLPDGTPPARFVGTPAARRARRRRRCTRRRPRSTRPARWRCWSARARGTARDDVLALADRLAAPMVLTLKAKEGLEHDNPFQVGQTGLIGNPAARKALDGAELLLMLGTDFPYSRLVSGGQGRRPGRHPRRAHRPPHGGRRTPWSGTPASRRPRCSSSSPAKPDRSHLETVTGDVRDVARRASSS